jgi:cell shape-determining protein MreD
MSNCLVRPNADIPYIRPKFIALALLLWSCVTSSRLTPKTSAAVAE